jgi:hypothetical protein
MKNRHGYTVEVAPIQKVEWYDDGGCAITRGKPGWGTFGLGATELNGFKPEVGDASIVYTQGFSMIRGVVIDGHVLRYETPQQAEEQHEQWKKNLRLERLERYIEHGEDLKNRAYALHPTLASRMRRFDAENGIDFWIEDAPYEMAVMEGAQALLDKVEELGFIENSHGPIEGNVEGAIAWIDDWWNMNTKEGGYDYEGQMALVPNFGDGHSGNTAGAAHAFAKAILTGEYTE